MPLRDRLEEQPPWDESVGDDQLVATNPATNSATNAPPTAVLDAKPVTNLATPPPDYAHSIPFPPDPPAGIPDAAPCPDCGLGLWWLDAYDNLRCYDCFPPPAKPLATRWLFVVSGPGSDDEGAKPPYSWADFGWLMEYPAGGIPSESID